MAQLNQPDRPIAATVQVGGEVAQDSIGVFIVFIDKGGKVALRVEHEVPSSWTLIGRERRNPCRLAARSRALPVNQIETDHRGGKPRWSIFVRRSISALR